MTAKRSTYASTYNTYSSINNPTLLMPRSITENRSQSPSTIDAELTNLKMDGKDYHVSVNLNALVSSNKSRNLSRMAKNNVLNQQQIFDSVEQSNLYQNSLKRGEYLKPSAHAGSNKTVLTLNGMDDSDVYQLYHQSLLRVAPPSKPSLSPPSTISLKIVDGGYAVKSVTPSATNQRKMDSRNATVEFDLQLRGQVQREKPVQSNWEVVGTVPIQRNGMTETRRTATSRSGARAVNEDEDEVDVSFTKDTSKELEDLLLNHPLIRDTPGDDVRIEKQKDQFIEPPTGPSEGMINMDIIEERVELLMKNEKAHVSVRVKCSRTVPLNNSRYFKKSSVIVVKSMDFDMTETDLRMDLYRKALMKQNLTPGGQLDQQETNRLYKALMKLIKHEELKVNNANNNNSGNVYENDFPIQQNFSQRRKQMEDDEYYLVPNNKSSDYFIY